MTVQFIVNIAMEGTMILLLSVLLVTCFWQKKLFLTTKPLTYLICFSMLVHIIRIVIWGLFLFDVPLNYGAMPTRIVYSIEYASEYAISVAFFYYMEAVVKGGYQEKGVTFEPPKFVHKTIIGWGIVTTLIYTVFLFLPSFYRVEMGQEIYSIQAYIFIIIMIKFALVRTVELIIRHRKVIDKYDAVLSVIFILVISVISVFDEMYGLCGSYVTMSFMIFILYVRIDLHKGLLLERQEKEIVEGKTQIMLSQMQPHFIYNVLTTISSLCEMQNALEARDVVNRFADYLRTNLDSLGKDRTISFEKELEHIKTYLWLEKIRFEDMLQICYEIEVDDFEVPSLSIQPIVENAVKHGIMQKEDAGTVTIKTYETDQDFVIVVEDDGVGFDVNEKYSDGRARVGIENVTKRLELICNGSCNIHSEIGKGTQVEVRIPKGEKR